MNLIELTEPLFQYVCRLNRLARKSGSTAAPTGQTDFVARAGRPASSGVMLDYGVVRGELKVLLDELKQKANADGRLSGQYAKVELPLLFFVDSMISESGLPFASEWAQNRLGYDRGELAGDQKFFDLLDDTMKESGDEAAERLAIYYTCLGLGFTGMYISQPEYLRRTMLTIAPRIVHLVERDPNSKMTPEAYQHVDTRNLVQPPGARLIYVGILFACLTAAIVVAYCWIYSQSSKDLKSALKAVMEQDLNTGTAAGGGK